MIDRIRARLKSYYHDTTAKNWHLLSAEADEHFYAVQDKIWGEMNAFYEKNRQASTARLKSRLQGLIAENCDIVIFPENPFYYEIGMREANSWGLSGMAPSNWIRRVRQKEMMENHPIVCELEKLVWSLFDEKQAHACVINSPFDIDHHTLGYRMLFKEGVGGIMDRTRLCMSKLDLYDERYDYCEAILEGCEAILLVAKRFSEKATEMLRSAATDEERESLLMIAETARRIPLEAPKSFYEGLEMLIFMREITATMENIGISSFGQVDLLLGELYENDLKSGRITEARARDLIGIWMLYTDIKFYTEENDWPETSTCIQLGGCDADGTPVFNKITVLTVEVHEAYNLVNPKLNCRYSQNSPKEYLRLLSRSVLNKHNNFTMQCDDLIIPSLMHAGISEADARFYVNGGCQETMIEGMGHSAGAYVYINLARFLDLSLRPHHIPADHYSERVQSATPKVIRDVESFEEFYQKLLENIQNTLTKTQSWRVQLGSHQPDLHPCPLYSLTQKGCIESGKDYTAGGAKYNIATFCAYGLGTLTDSLYAIKTLVFDEQVLTLEEFNHILETDWENNELLRRRCINLPKYGHGNAEVDNIANRLIHDLNQIATAIPNERGGMDILSFFVYYHYKTSQKIVRATPDGRKNGDLLSQGISPSQLQSEKSISETAKSIQTADFSCVSGNAVLDIRLPLSAGITEDVLADAILSLGKLGCPTVQPNVLSVQDLIDAKKHPEAHKDLIVRISGLSAFFVSLAEDIQDEIIARNQYQA